MSKKHRQAPAGFRQAMAWLHTWCGLWISWLLFAVFLTGSLSVFQEAIGHWMTPEHAMEEAQGMAQEEALTQDPAPSAPAVDRAQRFDFGTAYMAQHHPRAEMWEIWPANRHQDGALVAYWLNEKGLYESAELDAQTGQAVAPHGPGAHAALRETRGGNHFVSFHYELHAGTIGLWVVGFAATAMLVALVSGIVTHKRIFKDFFTFRPAKGQRSWLDAHNAVAVLTLPFQFMIAYTGLAISGLQFMPAATLASQGVGPSATVTSLAELNDPGKPRPSGQPLAVPALEPFAQRAEKMMGQQVRTIVIDHPGDRAMRIGVYGWNEDHEHLTRISGSTGMVAFSAATGEVLSVRLPGGVDGGSPRLVQQVIGDLHMATFGGLAIKWLYFLCGLAGSAMMATGALLFMVKRRSQHGAEFGAATVRVYRLVEGLNVAAIAGLAVACVGYLWANRLIPPGWPQRSDWELGAFFGVWALMLAHAFVRAPARAWIEQLTLLAALCLTLPLLNLLTTSDHLAAQIARGDGESAGVELTVLLFGALCAWALPPLRRRLALPGRSRVRTPAGPRVGTGSR